MPKGCASLGQGQGSLDPAGQSPGRTWCAFSPWPRKTVTLRVGDLGKAVSEATRWCPRSSLLPLLSPACPRPPGSPQTTAPQGGHLQPRRTTPATTASCLCGGCPTPRSSAPRPSCHQHPWGCGDRTFPSSESVKSGGTTSPGIYVSKHNVGQVLGPLRVATTFFAILGGTSDPEFGKMQGMSMGKRK